MNLAGLGANSAPQKRLVNWAAFLSSGRSSVGALKNTC